MKNPYAETLNIAVSKMNKYEQALKQIIVRSNTDPLGTSKVQDMRKIAEKALSDAK